MMKIRFVAFGILFMAIVFYVAFLLLQKESTSTDALSKHSRSKSTARLSENSTDMNIGEKQRALKQVVKRIASDVARSNEEEPKPDYDPYLQGPPPTEEEKKIREEMRKISHVYWEQGPSVLEEILEDEQPDENWRGDVEKSAKEMLEKKDFSGTVLADAQCGQTICKAVFTHDDESMAKKFDDLGGLDNQTWAGNSFGMIGPSSNGESGQIDTIVYFGKKTDKTPFNEMRQRLVAMVESGILPPRE